MRKAAPFILLCVGFAAAVGTGIYRGEPLIPLILKSVIAMALLVVAVSNYRDGKRSA